MKPGKWIFSIVLGLSSTATLASTTKVGNGDDGGDLEGAQKITSGIIFEARKEAIMAIKALNLQGVAGLGNLLPELENTELILTKADAHPVGSDGDWESSTDHHTVFARTFAEPYSPTRFFPAALNLSRDQLIALHTHEALHRALPPGVRENEDKVALLTMAITSPSATFDRVSRVAGTVLSQPAPAAPAASSFTAIAKAADAPKRAPSHTELEAEHIYATNIDPFRRNRNIDKVAGQVSVFGVHAIDSVQFESLLKIAAFADIGRSSVTQGPISFTSETPFYIAPGKSIGPYLQYNMKALDSSGDDTGTWTFDPEIQRDVYTLGAFFKSDQASTYNHLLLTYTLPSTYTIPGYQVDNGSSIYQAPSQSVTVSAIWSLWAHEGFKLGKFSLGGAFELHRALGYGRIDDFTILRAGPEIKWSNGYLTAALSAIWKVNNGYTSLNDLGDLAGHGSGRDSTSVSLAYGF